MILPAVVKKVLSAVVVPVNVRAIAVPATVTPPFVVAEIEPSVMERVTVRFVESMSANGVPV